MVYHGPSNGCLTCRRRKVKCIRGEGTSCNNCTRRKEVCPGFDNVFDSRHRDQTQSVIKRVGPNKDEGRRTPVTPESDSWSPAYSDTDLLPAEFSLIVPTTPSSLRSDSEVSLPFNIGIPHDLETTAVNFFFANFSRGLGDRQASHGFMPRLPSLYAASSVHSPLQAATASVSTNMLMLFSGQGSDTAQARGFYTKAISTLKAAIANPNPNNYDDMITAILVLDFYEELNQRFWPDRKGTDAHKQGVIALISHRNSTDYQSRMSRFIASDVRSFLCHWAIDQDKDIPPAVISLLSDPSLSTSKSNDLDAITLQLADLSSRFRKLYRRTTRWSDLVDAVAWECLLDEALNLDILWENWVASVPADWHPLHVSAKDLEPSIVKAGVYGDTCSIYKDLTVCDVYNTYRLRRLSLLRIIQQCCMLSPGQTRAAVFESKGNIIQSLVDEICESLPFHVGDAMLNEIPNIVSEICFPYTTVDGVIVPDPEVQHPRSAIASGGWIIYSLLKRILQLTEPEDGILPISLSKAKKDWMRGQLRRIEIVYTFVDS